MTELFFFMDGNRRIRYFIFFMQFIDRGRFVSSYGYIFILYRQKSNNKKKTPILFVDFIIVYYIKL